MVNVPQEVHERFEGLYRDNSVSPRVIERFIDENIQHPSFVHFMYRQMIWAREDQEITSRALGREVNYADAMEDYETRFSDDLYVDYFIRYIVPIFCSPEKQKQFEENLGPEKQFVENVFDKVTKITDIGSSSLLQRLARDLPKLAESIERRGLVAKASIID